MVSHGFYTDRFSDAQESAVKISEEIYRSLLTRIGKKINYYGK
ncbi:hypothetical protein AC062_0619 [Pasteurellaceae bacterium NI1060]|nr:hypothetical protein AC062_0619 [Pasteurellaceae bacterium NI1060]